MKSETSKQVRKFPWRTVFVGFLSGAFCCFVCVFSFFRTPISAKPIFPEDPYVELALDKQLPEVWLSNAPLDQAVKKISQISGVPIDIDEESLGGDAISRTMPITVQLRNATLAVVMNDLTGQIRTPSSLPLTWTISRQHLRIIHDGPMLESVTRVYHVGDLLMTLVPKESVEPVAVDPSHIGPFGPSPDERASTVAERHMLKLLETESAIKSWQTGFAIETNVRFLGGDMIVTQPIRFHYRLRRFLSDLKAPNGSALPAPPPRPPPYSAWRDEVKQWMPVDSDATAATLRRRQRQFEVDRQPVNAALASLGKIWQLPIYLHPDIPPALLQRLISLKLREVDGTQVLRAILEAASEDADASTAEPHSLPVDWGIDRGLLVVIPRDEMTRSMFSTVTYDLREWFGEQRQSEKRPDHGELAIEAQKSLMAAVAPESWFGNGGLRGTIMMEGSLLIVSQTYANQEAVRCWAEQLNALGRQRRN